MDSPDLNTTKIWLVNVEPELKKKIESRSTPPLLEVSLNTPLSLRFGAACDFCSTISSPFLCVSITRRTDRYDNIGGCGVGRTAVFPFTSRPSRTSGCRYGAREPVPIRPVRGPVQLTRARSFGAVRVRLVCGTRANFSRKFTRRSLYPSPQSFTLGEGRTDPVRYRRAMLF
jgi:hypothetical protein